MVSHVLMQLALRQRLLTLSVATTGLTSLSATATGYARTTGSFLLDGFARGLELTPSGFSSNPVSVIRAVTALSITVDDARAVEGVAGSRALTVSLPTQRAWENVDFVRTPGKPYIEEQYLPGPMHLDSLGANGDLTVEPMYHVNIYTPENAGISADGAYADALIALFAPSSELVLSNGDVLFVRADLAPYRGQRQQDAGFTVIPVTIPLRALLANDVQARYPTQFDTVQFA